MIDVVKYTKKCQHLPMCCVPCLTTFAACVHPGQFGAQGSGGAYEISQRMTAMLGWGATVNFTEDWTWSQACDTYVMDQEMADKLRKNNPQAFRNTLARMLEASGRGMWDADASTLEKLQEVYSNMDEELEKIQL